VVDSPTPPPLKFPQLPVLDDYDAPAPAEFWKTFPFNPLPAGPSTAVRADKLKILIKRYGGSWSQSKRRVAARAVKNLLKGAKPAMAKDLPPLDATNAGTAILNGREVTDTIADWIQKGFVAGPFDEPPLKNFRCNPIMAVIQPSKIRPVLNMSAPKGASYNEALNEAHIPKLSMATARDFSYSAAAAGKGARMSKLDLKDAYKNIPSHPDLWAAQGFKWLGKYFVDLTTVFGSKSAPADFDCLGATLGELAKTISRLPKEAYHRTLDDTTIVCKNGSRSGRRFVAAYRRICKFINIQLAEEDEEREKAFADSTEGTVLGIKFDTITGTWSLPDRRMSACSSLIKIFSEAPGVHLQQAQQLIGNLEAFGQLAPFTKGFKWNLLAFLRSFGGDQNIILPVPQATKEDLRIWECFLEISKSGMIIMPKPVAVPLTYLEFVSDAAGRPPAGSLDRTGAASLGVTGTTVWFGCKTRWPVQLLWAADSRSAVYELLGVMLPILVVPERLANKVVLLKVDNQAVVWAWQKRHMKQDSLASVLLRAIHILEAAVNCQIIIEHLPRMSTAAAAAADRLSRDSTEQHEDLQLLTHPHPTLPKKLSTWMKNPNMNWNLGFEIANEINI